MSFEIANPFPVFTDTNGEPLENGKIFIGVTGKNPETDPVAVFFDDALTAPAAQPIRTLGGYPSRDGTPTDLFIAQNSHSITVRDKNDEFVFSDPGVTITQTEVLFFDTIAKMTEILKSSITNNQQIFVGGYNTIGDDGGGPFFFNASNGDAEDLVKTFATDEGGTGRWERELDGLITVRMGGATGDGATNDTFAFTRVRTVTGVTYFIPNGTYILDASPDVKADAFSTGDNVTLTIAGTPFDVSNNFKGQLIAGNWNSTVMDIDGAYSGVTIAKVADGSSPSQSHVTFLPLETRGVNHGFIQTVASGNTFTDTLFRRAIDDATDPSGNRFSYTYDDANDRFQFSFATTASGAPAFDAYMQIFNGADATPRVEFPALRVTFNQGWAVQNRAATGFFLEILPISTDTVRFKDTVSGNFLMSFGSDALGFYTSSPVAKPSITGSRGGIVALASLLTALDLQGLITDNTTV